MEVKQIIMEERKQQYFKYFGFNADKFLIMPNEVAKHAKSIPGSASMCAKIDDEDSQKYFDEVGYHLVSRKWAEQPNNGIMEMYDNYMAGNLVAKQPTNNLPLMTPEQAFDEAPKAQTGPPPPQGDAPAGPPPPQEEPKEEVKEEYIHSDLKGNQRDPNTATLVSKLVGFKNKLEFLYTRGYGSDEDSSSKEPSKMTGKNGEVFTIAELEAFSAGQFYDAYVFKTNKGKLDKAAEEKEKPAEENTSVDVRKAELEALGFEMDKHTYTFKRGSDKVSHSKLQVLKNSDWKLLLEEFNKDDEEEKAMMLRYEARKASLVGMGFEHTKEDQWENKEIDSNIHNGDVVTMDKKDFDGVLEAFELGIKAKQEAETKEKTEIEERIKKKAQDLKDAEELDKETERELMFKVKEKLKATSETNKKEMEKLHALNLEKVPEEIKEIAKASDNIIIASVPPIEKEPKEIDGIYSFKSDPDKKEKKAKKVSKSKVVKIEETEKPVENKEAVKDYSAKDRGIISGRMEFADKMADVLSSYSEYAHAIHQIRNLFDAEMSNDEIVHEINNIINNLD